MATAVQEPIGAFLDHGFQLREQLAAFLQLSASELEQRLPNSTEALAAAHPGALDPSQAEAFYESEVGDGHLYELAAWHLGSADYIADTLRLQAEIAHGQHLDFGGGIGTHALAAAQLDAVDHVWMVELNGRNRRFVDHRAEALGLSHKLTCLRDLDAAELPEVFDSLTCLDVLEHLADPSAQLKAFAQRLTHNDGVALLNWYFFKGHHNEYPFHFDDPVMVKTFFSTLQDLYLERFHPHLITARTYTLR